MANILICDDEPNIRQSIYDILVDEGHTVFESESGLKGLTICRQKKIDIAIIDIWMPGLTGVDMVKKLHDLNSDTVSIVISGHESNEDTFRSIQEYAFDFIEKPLSLTQILDVVKKALQYKKNKK